jgi:hypothetical protein
MEANSGTGTRLRCASIPPDASQDSNEIITPKTFALT